MPTNVYEPIKQYKQIFKRSHKENVSDFFEDLVKRSNINEEENRETIKKIKKEKTLYDRASKQKRNYTTVKTISIILMVISAIVAVVFFINLTQGVPYIALWADILILIGLILFFVGLLYLIRTKINVIIKTIESNLGELEKKILDLEKQSWEQMAPLNRLFDWGMSEMLLTKTLPLITLDPYFDPKRYDILHNKYNLWGNENLNSSVLHCQSGEILGNPFVLGRNLTTYMGTKTYTGSKVITWTTTVSDGKGGSRVVVRTQTLTARITKPAPMYYESTFLVYANEAAPDLSFSRKPSFVHKLSEREIDRKVKKEYKSIDKQARKSVTKGTNFTSMTDARFEVLFNALDRNHEVQFRLLFTPLGQREMLNVLLDDKIGYGDDFEFHKQNMLNIIMPQHLNQAKIDAGPEMYISNDIDLTREIFNNYNNTFFKSVYFAFAPILSIPLYQQHKSKEYIYKEHYQNKVSPWEHEAMLNKFSKTMFRHPLSATLNILKSKFIKGTSGADEVEVESHGYSETSRVEVVNKLGGDGRIHAIPVTWYEYNPVKQKSRVVVKPVENLNRTSFLSPILAGKSMKEQLENRAGPNSEFVYKKDLIAYTSDTKLDPLEIDNLNKLLYNKDDTKKDD